MHTIGSYSGVGSSSAATFVKTRQILDLPRKMNKIDLTDPAHSPSVVPVLSSGLRQRKSDFLLEATIPVSDNGEGGSGSEVKKHCVRLGLFVEFDRDREDGVLIDDFRDEDDAENPAYISYDEVPDDVGFLSLWGILREINGTGDARTMVEDAVAIALSRRIKLIVYLNDGSFVFCLKYKGKVFFAGRPVSDFPRNFLR